MSQLPSTSAPTINRFRYYDLILAAFVAVLLISNLAAVKLIAFGPIITDGGAILFPLAYIFGDILTEVYGFRYTRRAIWMGFFVMLVAVAAFTVVRFMPAAAGWDGQAAYVSILGFFPRIVLASLVAYLVGEFINSFVLAKLKIRTGGKKLWFRLISSTVVGEFFDTIIFCLIAFGGLISNKDMVSYILVGWLFKTGVEVLMLPITYRVISALKRRENVDYYDRKTNFTPFALDVKE
jgi:queuosine precursor transporter